MPDFDNGNIAEISFRALIRIYGLLGRIMQPYFGQWGISGSQWGVLRAIYWAEQEGKTGLRMLELGDRLLVRPPSVSGLVNRLQKLGYVKRYLSKTDLRGKEVRLTPAGRDLVLKILEKHRSQIELLMGGLTDSELRQFSFLMDRITAHLDAMAAERGARLPYPHFSRTEESGENGDRLV